MTYTALCFCIALVSFSALTLCQDNSKGIHTAEAVAVITLG